MVNGESELIVYYVGNFNNVFKWYGIVVMFKFNFKSEVDEYIMK